MPSVKIPKKSTENDMTPFVDVAFLILSFFIMATKFKPPQAVEITTPNSVSSKTLEEKDAVVISLDKEGRVFFTMQVQKATSAPGLLIKNLNDTRNLGLTNADMAAFRKDPSIAVPFTQVKQYLELPEEQKKNFHAPGVPVQDSASNELYYWVRDAINAFANAGSDIKVDFMIKGDNAAKYPAFKEVLAAFKRNDQNKFLLITTPEGAPEGTDLYRENMAEMQKQKK